MLHLFYGNDRIAVRQKAHTFIADQEQKGVKIERIEAEQYSEGLFTGIANTASLFGETMLYVIDTPSEKSEVYDAVVAHLHALSDSENIFVIIETSLTAAQKKKFQNYTHSLQECVAGKKETFNIFSMADALARKDKKTLWMQLQDAQHNGLSCEKIIGVLWWQLKSLRLAKYTSIARDAGMKDFPYNKAKRALPLFKEKELEKLSEALLTVYHEGHLGRTDISTALELWVLTL